MCMNRLHLLLTMLAWFAGCQQASQDYFPLAGDLYREYVIEEQVNNEKHVLKSIVTSLEPRTIEGITYYPQRFASGKTWFFRKSPEGIFATPDLDWPGKIVLGFPLIPGTAWQTETRLDILHRRHESFSGGESFISLEQKILLDFRIASIEETVRVPAGQFTHCLRVDGTGNVKVEARTRGIESIRVEQTDWYARGMGLVKRVRTEKSIPEKYQGTLIQELVTTKH